MPRDSGAATLRDLLAAHRAEVVERSRSRLASHNAADAPVQLAHALDAVFDEVVDAVSAGPDAGALPMDRRAARQGRFLYDAGEVLARVVHLYCDVAKVIEDVAVEHGAPLDADDKEVLARWLEAAISEAVTEFARQRDVVLESAASERLGHLAHELRNLVSTASLTFAAMKTGQVGPTGATALVMERTLSRLAALVSRSLGAVRLYAHVERKEAIEVAALMDEVAAAAALEARARGVALVVVETDPGLRVVGDAQVLAAAMANLLQNAFKFTRPDGRVWLAAQAAPGGGVRLTVEDECGGLAPGVAEAMFRPFQQRHEDRSGLGLGLAITREGVAASGGRIRVENKAGIGCVFVIDLPAASTPAVPEDVPATTHQG